MILYNKCHINSWSLRYRHERHCKSNSTIIDSFNEHRRIMWGFDKIKTMFLVHLCNLFAYLKQSRSWSFRPIQTWCNHSFPIIIKVQLIYIRFYSFVWVDVLNEQVKRCLPLAGEGWSIRNQVVEEKPESINISTCSVQVSLQYLRG